MNNTESIKINKPGKKAKTIKPQKPVYNEFVCSPELQKNKPAAVVIGYILRAAVIYIGVLGMILFICDAFKIRLNGFALAGAIALIVTLFCVMSINKALFFGGLGLSAAGAALAAYLTGNPVQFFMNSVATLWNHMLDRLDYAGYRIMTSLYLPVDSTVIFTEAETYAFMFSAVIMITVIIAAVFTASLIRRVRLMPLLLVSAVVLTVIFTYNISSSNWGFALILSAFCGIIPLKMYDSLYNRKKPANDAPRPPKKSLKTSAMGGYVGSVSMVLCFLVLLIPTLTVDKQWEKISFINDKMELGRAIVSSVIIGDTPNIDMGFVGNMDTMNARSTFADERTFNGREMLRVYASYNMPLYLRSWVASSYNDDENTWNAVSTSKASQYTSWFYPGFTPEVINYYFYNLVNPRLTNVNSFTSYSNHIEDGFITETIDVENLNSSGNLLFTAAAYNPEIGLMNFMSTDRNDLYSGEWKFYYEGIVTTGWFNFNKKYRMTAFVPSYRYEDYAARLENNLHYHSLMKYYILQTADTDLTPAKQRSVIDSATEMLEYYDVSYTEPTALERYFDLSPAERETFVYNHFTLPDYYDKFVYDEYTAVPDSEALRNVTSEITNNMGPVTSTHEVVMSVIDYLKENCVYTLSPREPRNVRMSALDVFLSDTKEGYCVQFATSAAMILRQLGIPTRYVEGYLINRLTYDKTPERLAKYQTVVRDYNAHAWIEVYMGAAGWKLYETTPEYYSDLYDPYTTSSSSSGYTPMPEPERPEPIMDDGPLDTKKPKFILNAETISVILI
ncbi:MAG: transglutaminase-like domain-containing protein, partial [Eubacteriales bacterium]|nr:transglutaminase-like domain-containing protein [Eubacteriales bacterium]